MAHRVRCPRCQAVVMAEGSSVTCARCGLAGRVQAAGPQAAASPAAGPRDPWTITIDLRRLSPTRWSPGFKAFSTVLMLAVVFFAGGVSGVAFERARNEVTDDLGKVGGLVGSGGQGAGQPGGGGTGMQGTLSGTATQTGTHTGSGTQTATGSGTQTGTGSGSQTGTQTDTGSGTQTGTQGGTQTGTGGPTGTHAATGDGVVHEFTGSGSTTTDAVSLPKGLVRFTMSHYGSAGSFRAHLVPQGQATPAATAAASDPGAFTNVVRYVPLAAAGEYQVRVVAEGGGNWEVDVEVVGHEEPEPGSSFSFSGNGDGGRGPYAFAGTKKVTFTPAPERSYEVQAYRPDGSKITGCSFAASAAQTKQCTEAADGAVYFDVKTGKAGSDWTLKVE